MNAARASGWASRTDAIAGTISVTGSDSNSLGSPPINSTARNTPPTIGTASSVLNNASATNWMTTTCQLAAVMRAPRLRESFRDRDTMVQRERGTKS
jgi:hypothetical protein